MTDFRTRAAALDADEPLAHWRDAFGLRDDLVHLDGNSLGALPGATAARVADTITRAWGDGLTTSWVDADGMRLTPLTLRLAEMVAAVGTLADICRTRAWDRPDYPVRAAMT